MGETSFVECAWCHRLVSLAAHRKHHGKWGPRCLQHRTNEMLMAGDLRYAGAFAALLEAAGVTRLVPTEFWYWETVESPVDEETGEIREVHVQHHVVGFTRAAPRWAYELAKRLTQDKKLAARLGYLQLRQLVRIKAEYNGPDVASAWRDVALPKTMPFAVRAKIIRVAGTNSVAREMVYDDPESAAVIIRDSV